MDFFSLLFLFDCAETLDTDTQRQTTRLAGFLMCLVSSQPALWSALVPSVCHLHHLHLQAGCFRQHQPSRDPVTVSLEVLIR